MKPLENTIDETLVGPSSEPAVDGLPATVQLGHVTPWRAVVEDPEHAVEHGAMIGPPPAASLLRKERLDAFPAVVGELVLTCPHSLVQRYESRVVSKTEVIPRLADAERRGEAPSGAAASRDA